MRRLIDEFLRLHQRQLAERLVAGHAVPISAIENFEYKGISLGLPGFIDKLAWKIFKKTFYRDPITHVLRGWNIRVRQTSLYDAFLPQTTKDGSPVTWGHYQVVANAGRPGPRTLEQALLLDYGLGGNPAGALLVRALRDPLVALQKDSGEALLGWSYLQWGRLQVPTPSYFLLLRDTPVQYIPEIPPLKSRG